MSYDLLSTTEPKARKGYRCIWCYEPIPKGDKHTHEVSIYDGSFQDQRWHPECLTAAHDYFRQEEEFTPGMFKRGTTDEA